MKFILFAMVFLCAAAGCALREGDARRPLPGGFSEASVTDEEVVEAAEFAAAKIAVSAYPDAEAFLSRIVSAEKQVVAGMNYRIVLEIEASGETYSSEAVVWRKLSGEYELISWSPLE